MKLAVLGWVVLGGIVAGPQTGGWPRPDEKVVCGPLTLEVYVSRTAHLFHVVDQLSQWDNACHGQYRKHMTLDAEDEALLARYAEVRSKRQWGEGLEQTFYTPLPLEKAIHRGIAGGTVTRAEAETIRPVLEHFAERVDALQSARQARLESAFADVDRERLTEAAERLARFTGVRRLTLPVFPLASPVPGGGGMDGGRLKWELGDGPVGFGVLVHEITHGFLMESSELLGDVVDRTPGLSMTLIGEGFAYAVAPGLYREREQDTLRTNVLQDRSNDEAWEDPGYGRQRMFGLALRPVVREAFEHGRTLEEVLPEVRAIFLALQEIETGPPGARPPGPPRLAVAGPAGSVVRERLLDSRFQYWIIRFDHDASSYDDVLPQLGRGDLLVLLVAGDDAERIPDRHAGLAPLAPDEIEARLADHVTIEEERSLESGLRVVLLAAPSTRELEQLASTTALLAGQ